MHLVMSAWCKRGGTLGASCSPTRLDCTRTQPSILPAQVSRSLAACEGCLLVVRAPPTSHS